jgi:ferredoxin-NADP reductase
MFLEAVQRGLPAALLYSVRHPGEAAFLADLAHLARQASAGVAAAPDGGPAYRVIATATAGGPGSSEGWRSGRISAALVREAAAEPSACDAYLCGPAAFMEAQARLLEGLGVQPTRIHTESFNF